MSETDTTNPNESAAALVVIDLGKHKRKQVKKLRKGEGKLMDKVQDALDELRSSGTIAADAQPVVVIVREKKDSPLSFLR